MNILLSAFKYLAFSLIIFINVALSQSANIPVVFSSDTLFFIKSNIGPFTPQQRAAELKQKLSTIIDQGINADSITSVNAGDHTNIVLRNVILISITNEDASLAGKTKGELSKEYISILKKEINSQNQLHSSKNLLISSGITLGLLIILLLLLFLFRKIFPKGYTFLEKQEGKIFKPIKFRSQEILTEESISSFFIVLLKGVRLAITLALFYYFITNVLELFPWTKGWNIKPILGGILSSIVLIAATFVVVKSVFAFLKIFSIKVESWKGTVIKSVKVKNAEVLSEDRIIEQIKLVIKVINFVVVIIVAYFFFTILFSFFSFSKTWASTLIGYIIDPLISVLKAFVVFLPNLFTIIVIVFVTRYVLKFIKFIFKEIEKGTISFNKFPNDWAEPTYKIVRFLLIAFAGIVIYPYLPGSNSQAFQGVSIFLGILFSLGSTSAIANMVGGVVLTYMRPFKIGDRVKIADTTGDIIEKTLLVTRVRTIKNVDISIPNAMVLGSHIINFSSSAKEKGLILHTSVTIGYDVPWKRVHELLISAAKQTGNTLTEPTPFILQTSLDDSYVSYELNVYTDNPGIMAKIYSELHQNIQDKFNEAGVEIMSPRYSAVRDGNTTAIPEEYLPKGYSPRPFRIFSFGNLFKGKGEPDRE